MRLESTSRGGAVVETSVPVVGSTGASATAVDGEGSSRRTLRLKFDFLMGEADLSPLFSGVAWGAMIWEASFVLAQYLERVSDEELGVRGKTVVELGACCGLPGLLCSLRGARKTVLTDLDEYLPVARASIEQNAAELARTAHERRAGEVETSTSSSSSAASTAPLASASATAAPLVEASLLVWGRAEAEAFVAHHGHFDLIIAAECVSSDVYGRASWEALLHVLRIVSTPGTGRILLCSIRRPGDGLDEFLERLRTIWRGKVVGGDPEKGIEILEFVPL